MALEQRLRDLENCSGSVDGRHLPGRRRRRSSRSAAPTSGTAIATPPSCSGGPPIDANPKLGEAHNNLAVIYMQTGRFDEALQELTLAEKAGFRVNPQFKADLKERAKGKR